MDIKINELKKVITSPVIIFLFVILNLFNLFIICEHLDIRDDFKVTNNIIKKFGYKIDDNMIKNFKLYYNDEIKKMNEITYKTTGKKYKNALELASDLKEENHLYSEKDIKFFNRVLVLENYNEEIKSIDDYCKKKDIMNIATIEIKKYRLNGSAAETVKREYRKLNKRFKEVVKNKEYKTISPIRKCEILFKNLFKKFLFEIMILSVIITGYLINYEFDSGTSILMYSTKRGRKLALDKLWVSIVITSIFATMIMAIGLLTYFTIFDYSTVWNVPISSYFNEDLGFSALCWWNVSFVKYMLLTILTIYVCNLLFNAITFFISMYIKNSYIVFSVFFIITAVGIIGIPGISTDNNLIFINGFNLFTLAINCGIWFMEAGAFFTFKYYEVITLGTCSVIMIILNILTFRRFNKVDIR